MNVVNKIILAIGLALINTAVLADKLPAVSHDGLHLMKDTKVHAVYMQPGADLSEYDKVAILDTYVAFRKNWQRDHNRDEVDPERRVTDKEMNQIREELAAEFKKVFVEVLSIRGGHQLVRIIDPEVVCNEFGIQWANRVTNKAEADRALRHWATLLNDHLAQVKSMSSD